MSLLRGRTVLIVDDDDLMREVLSDEFAFHGANVATAPSGDAAFALLQTQAFEVVISDVRMPHGDGISLMQRINLYLPVRPQLFLCSGYNDVTNEQQQQLNVQKIFTKPFDRDLLITIVAASLGISSFLSRNA